MKHNAHKDTIANNIMNSILFQMWHGTSYVLNGKIIKQKTSKSCQKMERRARTVPVCI
jgi:hypothetical protein